MTDGTEIFIGLGSNMDSPHAQIGLAADKLRRMLSEGGFAVARIMRSPPLGGPPQDDYLNTVCRLMSSRPPLEVLDVLLGIEDSQGRKRGVKWGPRTIDLDLLLFGTLRMDTPRLTLPHPGMTGREFVLRPILELAPGLIEPGTGVPYSDHLRRLTGGNAEATMEARSCRL